MAAIKTGNFSENSYNNTNFKIQQNHDIFYTDFMEVRKRCYPPPKKNFAGCHLCRWKLICKHTCMYSYVCMCV